MKLTISIIYMAVISVSCSETCGRTEFYSSLLRVNDYCETLD